MSINTISVTGAGTMGSGIAQVGIAAGFTLVDVSHAAVKRGVDTVDTGFARMMAKGKMTAVEKKAALKLSAESGR